MSTVAYAVEVPVEVPEAFSGEDWVPSPETMYRLSVDKYEAMVASGVFAKRDRLELLNGCLVTKMSEYPPHAVALMLLCEVLRRLVPVGFHLRPDHPLRIPSRLSVPEPDLVLARGAIQDYLDAHPEPKDAPLVVEIADCSLRDDRTVMAQIYGAGGVPVYWIVNLVDRQVEVCREPSDKGYGKIEVFPAGTSVPVVIDGNEVGRVAVDDILPRPKPTPEGPA